MAVQASTKNKFKQMREDVTGRILDAAKELFAGNGYAATTMQMIARRADLVPSAIYHYFAGKEDLLEAVLIREVEAIDKNVYIGLQRHPVPEDMDGFLDAMANSACENQERISLLCHLVQFRCVPDYCSDKLNILQHFHEIMGEYVQDMGELEKMQDIMIDFASAAAFMAISGHQDIFERRIGELKQKAKAVFSAHSAPESVQLHD